ncbi:hypothetical protein ACLB1M_15155 [Escherichia coli]
MIAEPALASLEYIEQNYNEKEICPYALMVYGVGDGGAGPGEEHIERLTRIRNIDGLPHVDFSRVDKFFTHADALESLPIISVNFTSRLIKGALHQSQQLKPIIELWKINSMMLNFL